MKIYLMMLFAFFAVAQTSAQCTKIKKNKIEKNIVSEIVKFENLPDGVKLDDEIRVNKFNNEGVVVSFETITVEQKLKQIGAKYIDGTLVDKNGKEIRFYKPPIRGTSQGFEEDKKQAEIDAKELADLKKKYTVIEVFINPLKFM